MRLIDGDALINSIKSELWDWNTVDGINATTVLKQTMTDIENMPTVDPMHWIPCSERLPDTDEMMLVTAQPKKGAPNVNRAFYMDGFWHGSGSMANVVAWMPLPTPYTETQP